MRSIFGDAVGVIVLLLFQVKYADAQNCFNSPGDFFMFGATCSEHRCHCKTNNERCNRETGICVSGCAPGWIGPGCQFRSPVYGASVESSLGLGANAAADGDINTCTVQNEAAELPSVRIVLEEAILVSEVIIHFRNLSAVGGFSVHAGTTSNRDQSTLCYRDLDTAPLDTDGISTSGNISVVCSRRMFANSISVTLPGFGRKLEICEIEVPVGRELSFNKPSFGSPSENGVPADVNNGHTRQFYASKEQTSPYWYVDLEEIHTINLIEIANREDLSQFIVGYQIHLSNDSDFTNAELVHTDSSTAITARTFYTIALDAKVARYIRITVPGERRRLHVREIWVIGSCAKNQCGMECTQMCYCADDIMPMANQVSGRCPGACERNVRNVDGFCNTSICPGNTYGYQCKYTCQCEDGCDPWSGTCLRSSSGCRKHHYGATCQARNIIAESGSTLQGFGSSYYEAFSTVDGLVDTCAPGLSGRAASWFIPLANEQPVYQVLVYVNETATGYGLEVAVENGATATSCNVLQVESGGRYLALCDNELATHVRVSTRSSMQICEVAVLECSEMTFGMLCEEICMCENAVPCDRYNGSCPEGGCESGYHGYACSEECEQGYYGNNCTSVCGQCNDGTACDIFSGECARPCQAGWMGGRCDVECVNGTYGPDCVQQCGYCYEGEPCDKATGVCHSGCSGGYFLEDCKTKCVPGRFGYNCNETCGMCNYGEICAPEDGKCASGCVIGKVPPTCVEDCPHGFYSQDCKKRCGSCRNNNTCDQVTGVCTHGCAEGVYELPADLMCNNECQFGRYGYNCSEACREDVCAGSDGCDSVSGACLSGCLHPGYMAPDCSEECVDGKYGLDCASTCGHCLHRAPCNKTTGHCPGRCDPGYAGPKCLDEDPQLSAVSIIILVLGCLLAVAGLVAVGIGYWTYKRGTPPWVSFQRRRKKEKYGDEKAPRNMSIVSRVYENNFTSESEPEKVKRTNSSSSNFRLSVTKPRGTISLEDLWDYVQDKKISRTDMIQQFKDLPIGLTHPCETAKKAQNLRKNRYKEIFAYDHSRVKLDILPGDTGNDYINACFIGGYNRPHMYIAAQGPTEDLVCDFWRMIWQKRCRKIVMLTRLVEHNKVKCCQYWPDDGVKQYGSVFVEFKEADTYADFTIRTFNIYMEGKETREIKQFHFESWADRHVPEYASSLVQFWTKLRTTDLKDNVPILVHCSAGIGRTGTFLALDYLVEQADVEGYVNVFQCIQNLRHQRVNMVQNQEQYVFLHEALSEALFSPSLAVPCERFALTYSKLTEVDPKTKTCKMETEFERLQQITKFTESLSSSFYDNSDYKAANNSVNKEKNRFSHILPSEQHRPFLITRVYDKNDYINAVYLPTYREDKMFLLTQNPLPDTIVDFWRMAYENKVSTIINFDRITNPSEIYWPREDETLTFIPFTLHHLGEVDHVTFIERTLRLQNAEESHEKARIIKLFECRFWMSEDRIPVGAESSILTVYEHVKKWQQTSGNHPIIVHCLNGATKSGLFCVITSALDRLRQDREVGLQQTIKQMRVRRHQIVPTYEQFKFCHDILIEYLKESDALSNFYI